MPAGRMAGTAPSRRVAGEARLQDKRRRRDSDALQHLVEQAVENMLAGLPPEEHIPARKRIRAEMARVLSESPIGDGEGDAVTALTIRARLAAAFRVDFDEA